MALIAVGVAVTIDRSRTDQPVAASDHLHQVLDLLQEHAYYAERVTWEQWEAEIAEVASTATSTSDVYPLVRRLVASLGDGHSRFLEPDEARAVLSGQASPGLIPDGSVDAGIGVLRLPRVLIALESEAGAAYAAAAWQLIGSPACGWVIDVRQNSGGDIGPMLAAAAPLLGAGTAVRYRYRDGTDSTFTITDLGDLRLEARDENLDLSGPGAPFRPLPGGTAVAVLQGPSTGSSGEGIVMAFHGRPNARTFGGPTYGVPTGVAGHELADGSFLAITETVGVDAAGTVHAGPIAADEPIDTAAGPLPPAASDPTLAAARSWIAAQPSCRQS